MTINSPHGEPKPQPRTISELLPFPDEQVAELYRTAEADRDSRLVPDIPVVGALLSNIIFGGQRQIGAYNDATMRDPALVNQAETIFTGRVRRAVDTHDHDGYRQLVMGFGNSLLSGLSFDRALEAGCTIRVRSDDEDLVGWFDKVWSADEPEVTLFEVTTMATGIDTHRVADGYAHRIIDQFGDLDPELALQVRGTRNAIGLGMATGYWYHGGE